MSEEVKIKKRKLRPSILKARVPIPCDCYPPNQFSCPICGCAVTQVIRKKINNLFGYRMAISQYKHCVNCGQKIDWEFERDNEQ